MQASLNAETSKRNKIKTFVNRDRARIGAIPGKLVQPIKSVRRRGVRRCNLGKIATTDKMFKTDLWGNKHLSILDTLAK